MAVTHSSGDVQAFWRMRQEAEAGQPKAQYNLGLMYANGVGVDQDFALALLWYKKAATLGYSPAQYILAGKYANGQGVERDIRQALSWYMKASDRGNSRALFKLGQMLSVPQEEFAQNCYRQAAEKGIVEAQVLVAANVAATADENADPGQAFAWYQKAAESGLPAAQYIVGTYFDTGKAGKRDIQEAIGWYRKAARQGFAPAQTQLGLMYLRGEGVPRDNKQAMAWIARAAEQGDTESCYQLGLMYETGVGTTVDLDKAEANYLKSAENGDVRAQLKMAALSGEEREAQAAYWYERAAQSGNAEALLNLGLMCAEGKGVAKNVEKALTHLLAAGEHGEAEALVRLAELFDLEASSLISDWYQSAAGQGNPQAQYALANRLHTGNGVGMNRDLALYWYQKAAESGIPEAQYWFGKLLVELESADSLPEAVTWFRKSAKQGCVKAQTELGDLYVRGEGVPRDGRQAAGWYMKAAEQGDPEAQFALGELFAQGNAQGASLKHAEHWYRQAIEQGGDVRAMLALANLYRKTANESAETWFRLAAERGLARAQLQMGDFVLQKYGAPKAPEAVGYFIKAAAQGDTDAMRMLAQFSMAQPQLFVRALQQMAIDAGAANVELNHPLPEATPETAQEEAEKSVDWYLDAARNGDAVAQWYLGEIYAKGLRDVARNPEKARHFYQQSAQAGFAAAQAALAVMLASGAGGSLNEKEAVHWWEKAAEQGDAESQYNLALMYEKGQGVAQDFSRAMHWLRKAAEQGVGVAQTRLGLSYVMGRTGEPDLVEAYVWFFIAAAGGTNEVAQANRLHAETLMTASQLKEAKRRVAEVVKTLQSGK